MTSYEEFRKELEKHEERLQTASREVMRLRNENAALRGAESEAIVSGDDEAAAQLRKKILANEADLEQRQTETNALSRPVKALRQLMSKGKIGRLAETVLEENARQVEKLQKAYDEQAAKMKKIKAEFLAEVEVAGDLFAEGNRLAREMNDCKRFTMQANVYYGGVTTDLIEVGLSRYSGAIYITPKESQDKFYGRGL